MAVRGPSGSGGRSRGVTISDRADSIGLENLAAAKKPHDPEVYNPTRQTFDHFTNAYFQRTLVRRIDKSGQDALEAIKDHATQVRWLRSIACPNRRIEPGTTPVHQPDCGFCNGVGYIYWREDTIDVAITSTDVKQVYEMFGYYQPGFVNVHFPPGKIPNVWDRIILGEDFKSFTESVTVPDGEASTEGNPKYRLKYQPIRVEMAVLTVEERFLPTVDLPVVHGEEGVGLVLIDHSHILVEDGHIVGFKGRVPPASSVSFYYYYYPEFVVMDIQSISRDALSDVPSSLVQSMSTEEFENKGRGLPVVAIAAFDYLLVDNPDEKDVAGTYKAQDDPFSRLSIKSKVDGRIF